MKRSGTIHTIHELFAQGKSIHAIAREVGVARNTVRRYLRGKPEAVARPKRGSILDPYKAQIHQWMQEDHLYNCEVMLERLHEQGYRGNGTILRDYVRPFRPRNVGHQPVLRYETKPGEQMQYDWGEVQYEHQGQPRKLYAFTAVLGYSRMRFVIFVKRCDTPTMIRCMMEAFEYFGGLPKAALTDRMKSVFLAMEDDVPKWNPLFADFMAALGVAPRVCKPYKPQTKGKVERSVGLIKDNFWPGVRFTDIDDLNEQARRWCDRRNQKVHRTTRCIPMERWREEHLSPLPPDYQWERFGAEERRVSWDGFISYDGVLYGLPAHPPVAGAVVLVREHHRSLRIYQQGQFITSLSKQPRSHDIVVHPEQFTAVAPVAAMGPATKPVGHQVDPVPVAVRSLHEYDQLFGVEVGA
jgi:transposase